MGPYYDHASLQMRAFVQARRHRRDASVTLHSQTVPKDDDGQGSRRLAVAVPTVPGMALACGAAGLLNKLVAGDVWTMVGWRALLSASIVALAAAVSSLQVLIAR
jgi:hypothetical protein